MSPSDLLLAERGDRPTRTAGVERLDTAPERDAVLDAVELRRSVVVRGGAALGKSQLLADVAAMQSVGDVPTVAVRCHDGDDRPLGAIASLAGQLLHSQAAADASALQLDALRSLAGFGTPTRTPTADDALVRVQELLTSTGAPVWITIDDIHLAGPLTRRVVRRLAESVATAPGRGRIVVAERIEPGSDPSTAFGWLHLPDVTVEPWDADRITAHLRRCLGDVPSLGPTAAWIARSSGGLPQHVAALCARTIRTHDEMALASRLVRRATAC